MGSRCEGPLPHVTTGERVSERLCVVVHGPLQTELLDGVGQPSTEVRAHRRPAVVLLLLAFRTALVPLRARVGPGSAAPPGDG